MHITETVAELTGKARGVGMMLMKGFTGIFRRLAQEHGEVNTLMLRARTSSDPQVQREMLAKIRTEFLSHAHAEEKEFYAVLRTYPETREKATHSKAEHDEIEQMLDQLENLSGAAWTSVFNKLMTCVQHHVKEEENELFPLAKSVLSSDQVKDIERRFAEAKQAELARLG